MESQQKNLIPLGVDVNEVGRAIAVLLANLHVHRISYVEIANKADVNLSNIKKLASFAQDAGKNFYRGNETLGKLYKYFKEKEDFPREFLINNQELLYIVKGKPKDTKEIEKDSMYQDLVTGGYQVVYNILHVSDADRASLQDIAGDYFVFRNAQVKNKIVISFLTIKRRQEESNVWEFFHNRRDRHGDCISGDGVLIPLGENIHLIGDIEMGKGLEYIVLREPFSREFSRIIGLTVTMGFDRHPLLCRVCLVKKQYIFDALSINNKNEVIGVYHRNEFSNVEKIKDIIDTYCNDKNEFNTAMSIDSINVEES